MNLLLLWVRLSYFVYFTKANILGPRNRAPLGTKTTNVKLNTSQTLARSALRTKPENTNLRVTSTRRPKKVIHPDTKKLEVCDAGTLYNTSDVEYCPPAIKEIPFESDTFPDNCLDYSRIQPQNLMKDLYKSNLAQLDANGLSKLEKEQEIAYQKDILNADEAAKKMMDEDWIIGDIPETFHHQQTQKEVIKPVKGLATSQKKQYRHCQVISTLTSSKATHSLPITSKQKTSQPKAYKHATKVSSATSLKKPTKTGLRGSNNVTENNNFSIANSKSTIGYSKGRSIHSKFEEQKLTDHKVDKSSHLSMLTESRTTKNPEHKSQSQNSTDHYFLKLFDVDDGELDPGLRGILPDSVNDGEDEDFFFTFS